MLVRVCGVCGRKVIQGQRCECQKRRHHEYDRGRRDKDKAGFYSSSSWKRAAEAVRMMAGCVDEYVLHYERRLISGRLVHHIIPLDEAPERALELGNMVCVSAKTHDMIHKEYEASEERKAEMQRKLLAIRRGGGPPAVV